MKQTFLFIVSLLFSSATLAHGGHWHLDEETLAKIFGTADAVYGWFAANAVPIAALTLVVLTVWGALWWRRQRQEN